jgi:hypothetical protein
VVDLIAGLTVIDIGVGPMVTLGYEVVLASAPPGEGGIRVLGRRDGRGVRYGARYRVVRQPRGGDLSVRYHDERAPRGRDHRFVVAVHPSRRGRAPGGQ